MVEKEAETDRRRAVIEAEKEAAVFVKNIFLEARMLRFVFLNFR